MLLNVKQIRHNTHLVEFFLQVYKLCDVHEERRVSSSVYLYVQDAPCFFMFDPFLACVGAD